MGAASETRGSGAAHRGGVARRGGGWRVGAGVWAWPLPARRAGGWARRWGAGSLAGEARRPTCFFFRLLTLARRLLGSPLAACVRCGWYRWMVMVTGAENTVFANEEYILRFAFPADVRWWWRACVRLWWVRTLFGATSWALHPPARLGDGRRAPSMLWSLVARACPGVACASARAVRAIGWTPCCSVGWFLMCTAHSGCLSLLFCFSPRRCVVVGLLRRCTVSH